MKVTCCICGREKEEATCTTFVMTEAEKASIRKMGDTPQDSYTYCRPCIRILSNPATAAQLIKGVAQLKFRSLGAAESEQKSQRYYEFFLKNAKVKP